MQPVTAIFRFNVKNRRNQTKGEKNVSQTRTGFSERSPLHTFISQAFLIGKTQTAFVFCLWVVCFFFKYQLPPQEEAAEFPQTLAVRADHSSHSPPVHEGIKSPGADGKLANPRHSCKEGRDKQCNKGEKKNKTETNTLTTFSTTSFNQYVWQGKGKTWLLGTGNTEGSSAPELTASTGQEMIHCMCTVIIVINQETWKQWHLTQISKPPMQLYCAAKRPGGLV